MYSGGFYPFPRRTGLVEPAHLVNRYADPKPVYELLDRAGQGLFRVTTNVDHCFQRAVRQGACSIRRATTGSCRAAPRMTRPTTTRRSCADAGGAGLRADKRRTGLPEEQIRASHGTGPALSPGGSVMTNLRADDTFVEDAGWRRATAALSGFPARAHGQKIVYWEIGVGYNTPVIIKYLFWRMTVKNARDLCLPKPRSAFCPGGCAARSICLNGDIGDLEH